jgi:hypothetical protein
LWQVFQTVKGNSTIFHQHTALGLIIHFYVDLAVIVGAFVAAQASVESP